LTGSAVFHIHFSVYIFYVNDNFCVRNVTSQLVLPVTQVYVVTEYVKYVSFDTCMFTRFEAVLPVVLLM